MTHDDKRNGTTTFFAALNVLDGTVTAQNRQHHRHQEFLRFLNRIEAKRFIWAAGPDRIIAARSRGLQTLETIH